MAKQYDADVSGLQRLKQDIKNGNFQRLYFFYGEERYLQEHYLSVLKKKLVSGPMEDFNYRRLTPENMSILALLDAVEAMPMMADCVMVQVDDFDIFAQDEDTRKELAALLSDLPDTCCLVFTYDTVPFRKDGTKKKLLQVLHDCGCEVEFAKQSPSELAEWISRHFRALEKTISPDLCQYMIFLAGGIMTTLHTEIEKVASYSRQTAITRMDIDAVVEPVLGAVVFDITDSFAENNYDKALAKLREVLQTKEEPVKILSTIGAHFRKLLYTKTVSVAGQGSETLMTILGTNSNFYCQKMKQQAARLKEEFCLKAVELCYETDCKMKRSYDDARRLLEFLVLTLAQEAAK